MGNMVCIIFLSSEKVKALQWPLRWFFSLKFPCVLQVLEALSSALRYKVCFFLASIVKTAPQCVPLRTEGFGWLRSCFATSLFCCGQKCALLCPLINHAKFLNTRCGFESNPREAFAIEKKFWEWKGCTHKCVANMWEFVMGTRVLRGPKSMLVSASDWLYSVCWACERICLCGSDIRQYKIVLSPDECTQKCRKEMRICINFYSATLCSRELIFSGKRSF